MDMYVFICIYMVIIMDVYSVHHNLGLRMGVRLWFAQRVVAYLTAPLSDYERQLLADVRLECKALKDGEWWAINYMQ